MKKLLFLAILCMQVPVLAQLGVKASTEGFGIYQRFEYFEWELLGKLAVETTKSDSDTGTGELQNFIGDFRLGIAFVMPVDGIDIITAAAVNYELVAEMKAEGDLKDSEIPQNQWGGDVSLLFEKALGKFAIGGGVGLRMSGLKSETSSEDMNLTRFDTFTPFYIKYSF